jgi:general nucleoside transport system permease protein
MTFFTTILPSAIVIASILLYGCTGEILMEKSGHLNLGVPGVMCIGTFGGCLGASIFMSNYTSDPYSAPWFGLMMMSLLFSAIFGLFAGLIYAILTVTLKCNQNVTGLALTIFGAGFADFLMSRIDTTYFAAASKILRYRLPFAETMIKSENGFVASLGSTFFSYGFLVYLSIIITIIVAVVLKRTRVGLSLRSVGENPATADAAGINVTRYKYGAILIGSVIAGFGGLTYVMENVAGSWENSTTIQAFGWLAIALVIFCVWKPILGILGSIVFGFLFILPTFINGINSVQMKLLNTVPYVVTIIVLVITSIVGKKSVQPPASLGQSYFREDR